MNVQSLLYRAVDDGMLRYARNLIAFIRMDMFLLPTVGVRRGVQRDGRKDQRIRRHEHHDAGGDREPPVPTLPQQALFIQLFRLSLNIPIHRIFPF